MNYTINKLNNIIKNLQKTNVELISARTSASQQIDFINKQKYLSYSQKRLASYLKDFIDFCDMIKLINDLSIQNFMATINEQNKLKRLNKVSYGNKRARHTQINKGQELSSVQKRN